MTSAQPLFEFERQGETVVVTALQNLDEFKFHEIELAADETLELLQNGAARNVVIDLGRSDYCGSTALGFFLKLWKRVREREGRMALCNVSPHEKEVLAATKLEHMWPVCESREAAMKEVAAPGRTP